MVKDLPLLSIVIPTKNRNEYAIKSIEEILLINDRRIEVVIQDNSDINVLEEYFMSKPFDSRLKYNYCENPLSFVNNFNLALSNASGEYICLIGDDDGINPEIVFAVEWAKKHNISAITPSLPAQYLWPNSSIKYMGEKDQGSLKIFDFSSKVETFNSLDQLKILLQNGGQDYLALKLPKLYHGIIKRDSLERIKNITGNYIGGLTPDIYSVVALSIVIDTVVYIDYPLTIPGASPKSGSVDSETGKHTGKLEDAPHFKGHKNYSWATEVPKFYSVETIWADSILSALNDMKRLDLIKIFNLNSLTFHCLKRHWNYKNIIVENYFSNLRTNGVFVISNFLLFFNIFINKSFKSLLNKISHSKENIHVSEINSVVDIKEATNTLSNYLEEKKVSFLDIVK